MGETTVEDAAAAAPKAKPTIVVPQRGSVESIFTNGLGGLGFSPGPMTLVSSFFSDQGPFSFSQLLAGAMASPIAAKQGFQLPDGSGKEERGGNSADERENSETDAAGYKRNRPMSLVVGQPQLQPESLSPLFMIPPGLSPSGLLNSPGFLSPLRSPFGMSHQQALAHVTAQAALSQSYVQAELQHPSSAAPAGEQPHHSSSAPAPTETLTPQQTNPVPTEPENLKMESSEVSQSDKKAAYVAGEKPASDGYNWRKYGQKHVKASECPRSYYKCTHLNCTVKKKVERSADGRVSEIVYKGHHNHDPPQPNKRGRDSCAVDKTINSQVKPALASRDQTELNTLNEAVRVDTESVNFLETNGSFEHRPSANHNDEMEDNVIVLDDGDDDEPVAKRRTTDTGQSKKVPSHQTITESKIVVQTRSEVDLLDDGYKWRKYGQKVVKGNPHPRSYYRCTYAGCTVRKHVERSSADPKAVITTYEGKHNHEIPIGRYSNRGTANAGAQQLRGQKVGANNPLASREIDIGNDDQIPRTLHLKEEQINT